MSAGIALTISAIVVLLVAERRGSLLGKLVSKPLASTGFVALAIASGALTSDFGRTMLFALVLSWLGDVALIGRSRPFFLAGLSSFLLAHLAFAAAFLVSGIDRTATLVAAFALLAFAIGVARWLLPHVRRRLRSPVVAYLVAIVAMTATAAGAVSAGAPWALLAAAIAFLTSDLAVARDRFVEPSFVNRAWGLPLYYAAQLGFAATSHGAWIVAL